MIDKYIFLDIDGVLCNQRQYKTGKLLSDGYPRFDNHCVKLLSILVEKTGALIVISSSWRYGLSIEELQRAFKARKFKHWSNIMGVTDVMPDSARGEEVKRFVMNLIDRGLMKSYVILDDDADFLPSQLDNFVLTVDGLTGLDVNKCISILNQ